MTTGFFKVPPAKNELPKSYAPGTPEKKRLKQYLNEAYKEVQEIPMIIDGQEVRSGEEHYYYPPHDIHTPIAKYYWGGRNELNQAIDAALKARKKWMEMPWEHRVSIFLKAADLFTGKYRHVIHGATMMGQSKNPFQCEIEAVCELADFLRFNSEFASRIYQDQPLSVDGVWNRVDYRPLEGFVTAITPFNFTAISLNLPTAPAIMGNTVVWKPSDKQIPSAKVIMDVLREAGLPDGVINMVFAPGQDCAETCFSHPEFAGVHFTGSTKVFQSMWKTLGENVPNLRHYPRIVGETGGKDFIIAHKTADVDALVANTVRGAFEYQGQKCSAVSRAYIPTNIWEEYKSKLIEEVNSIKVGPPEDFTNFVNAVIGEDAFDKIAGYIDRAKESSECEIIAGGNYDKSQGYFIDPTVIVTTNPKYESMVEEIFGPVVTIYVYDENMFEETLELLDSTSNYGLTGAVFSQDREAIDLASRKLVFAAGNFYINDKPTGSIVGQQPFGGARGSGTNDKAGSIINLYRWVNARAIKETSEPVTDYRYPFLLEE